jgi:hypothetical protein
MKEGTMRVVRVKWEGPFHLDEVKKLDDEYVDFGLYQIHGRHIIFGADSLLYIGKTEDTFSKRVKGNYAGWKPGTPWHQDDNEVSVRVGRLNNYQQEFNYQRKSDFSQLLKDVEDFQIFCHSPPYNGTSISSYNGQSLIIENAGELGDLRERLSTAELNDSGMNLGEAAKYLLEVVQIDSKAATCKVIQSDKFRIKNKENHAVRQRASNEVLREELRDCFKDRRWSKSGDVTYKMAFPSENKQMLLSIKPISENKQMVLPPR